MGRYIVDEDKSFLDRRSNIFFVVVFGTFPLWPIMLNPINWLSTYYLIVEQKEVVSFYSQYLVISFLGALVWSLCLYWLLEQAKKGKGYVLRLKYLFALPMGLGIYITVLAVRDLLDATLMSNSSDSNELLVYATIIGLVVFMIAYIYFRAISVRINNIYQEAVENETD